MQTYYRDKYVRFEYGREIGNSRLERLCVGPQAWITLDEYEDADDDNSLFVNTASGNDSTGTGASATPFATITHAWNAASGDLTNIVIQNTVDYSEDLSACDNDLITGLYAASGATVRFTTRSLGFTPSDANSKFVAATGSDSTGDGTAANPYATIDKADDEASGKSVVIQDSGTYTVNGRTIVADGWYAALGQTPKINVVPLTVLSGPDTETTFNAAATTIVQSCVLSNGNLAIAYRDSDNYGKFVIYNSSGTVVVAETTFNAQTTTSIAICALFDGYFAIGYNDADDKGKFVIYNSSGTVFVSETTFSNSGVSGLRASTLPSGNFVLSYLGKFVIYNSSGSVVVSETTFSADGSAYLSTCITNNGNIVFAYSDAGDGNYGKFVIYNSSGTVVVAETTFKAADLDSLSVCALPNGNFVAAYCGGATTGKFVIYNSSGSVVVSETTVNSGATNGIFADVLSNGNFGIIFTDTGDSSYGKLVICNQSGSIVVSKTTYNAAATTYKTIRSLVDCNFVIVYSDSDNHGKFVFGSYYDWAALTVGSAVELNGITFDGDNSVITNRLFNATAKLTQRFCEIKNVDRGDDGYAIYSTAEIDAQNNLIHDNYIGIYTEENTGTFKYNGYYGITDGYALHIKGAAASGGDITVEHNTFFDNYAGLRLEDNGGSNEVVKNNVFASNDLYDINAETAMTTTYSVITGNTNNVTAGSGCITLNPMFVDETTPDLHLMNELCGDFMSSPALDLADDTSPDQDPGCYNTLVYGPGEQWVSIVLRKSVKFKITREPIGTIKNYSYDGDPYTRITGWIEHVELDFDGVDIGDLGRINAMLDSMTTDTTVRFYPDTVSDYYLYDTYRVIPDKVSQSPTGIYKLSQYGAQGIRLILERKYS